MRCLSCYYDLSHLTENRCPECGKAFDPTDSTTFDTGHSPIPYKTWHLIVLAILTFATAWCLELLYPHRQQAFGVGLLLLPVVFSVYAVVCSWRRRARRRQNMN